MEHTSNLRYTRISLAVHLAALTLLCLLFFRPSDQAQCAPVVQSAALPPAPPAQAEPAPLQAPPPGPQPSRPRAPRVALPAPDRPSETDQSNWGQTDLDRTIAGFDPAAADPFSANHGDQK